MNLTNKLGYPETILRAIRNDPYDKGDSEYSATGLIAPPRIRVLQSLHKDELTEDADDGMWRLVGQIGHGIVERAGTGVSHLVTEKRFFAVVADTKISAQIDSLSLEQEDGTLIDWKFTTVYGFKKDSRPKREWVAQMNIQNYLIGLHGLVASRLRIWGILRDWRPAESKREIGYPNKAAFHDIPMYSKEAVKSFIEQRILAHRAAETELPLCSQEDNWKWKRCGDGYCNVAKFCNQYQEFLKQKKETKI